MKVNLGTTEVERFCRFIFPLITQDKDYKSVRLQDYCCGYSDVDSDSSRSG